MPTPEASIMDTTAHPQLLALLHACKEEPEEDAPRLVLSDWLEEQGETIRAQLIRLQCRAARMSHRERQHQRTEQRIKALVRKCEAWLHPLREAGLAVTVFRGLLDVATVLDVSNQAEVRRLADTEVWAWVESVGVNGVRWGLPGLRRWLPDLLRETGRLTLSGIILGEAEAAVLAEADLPLLRELHMRPHGVAEAALGQLGRGSIAHRLRTLSLQSLSMERSRLAPDGAASLAAGSWDELRHLDLRGNRIGDAGAEALAGAEWISRLSFLDVHTNEIGPRGIRALLTGPRAVALGCVQLAGNPIGDEGAAVIAAAPTLAAVNTLSLSHCDIGPEGAAALASSTGVAHLAGLNLMANRIGDGGAESLARSPHLKSLRELYLNDNRIGDAGARALAGSPHLRGLKTLGLPSNPISETVRQELREQFGRGLYL
jgi:uncharacterized protein (TIGR02996 family)